ncbi:MAG: hypothetical protein GTO02_13530 [Candidatus Dadabacteria bacterium]|nr:hypothetical protein [Candidatus Dadabacteria bacterium]
MKLKLIIVLVVLALTQAAIATAQQSITEHGVTITSDKLHYNCVPVTSSDGCLIQSKITVENNNNFPINAFLEFDADKQVKVRQFRNKGLDIATTRTKSKDFDSVVPYLIGSNQQEVYDLEFFVKEDGKFNFSVFFNGKRTILDPFFNTTVNNTNPTLHLDSGRVTAYNDSQFLIIQNLTNELFDESDITKFETSRTQFTNNGLLSFLYQGSTSFFGEVQIRGDGSNASNNLDGASRYYEANTASPLSNGDQVEIHFQDSIPPSASLGGIFLTNTAQNIIYAKFESTAEATTHFLTLQNINTTASSFRLWANATEDTGDNEIVDLVRVSETVEGQALRVSFPIVLNTDNQYFLNVKKVSAGTEDFQVMQYNNNTGEVAEFLANTTFSSGFNNIELDVKRNISASFRIFSAVVEEISEVHLIEVIEDTEAPMIINFSVNPLQLSCNDAVIFEVNATDDNFIDSVVVTYNFSSGTILEEELPLISGNTYSSMIIYDFLDPTNGTYSLLEVNVTDLSGLFTVDTPDLQYNYFCNDTSVLPPAPPTDAYEIGSCDLSSLPRVIMLMFFFILSITLIVIGKAFQIGAVGVFGSIMLMILSVYIWGCIALMGIFTAAVGLLLMTHFALHGFRGTL